jgi:hypothetical protein
MSIIAISPCLLFEVGLFFARLLRTPGDHRPDDFENSGNSPKLGAVDNGLARLREHAWISNFS